MTLCHIALGSNLGDSIEILQKTFHLIEKHPAISQMVCSSIYKTTPVGIIHQPDFFNAACAFRCALTADALYSFLSQLEHLHGRTASHHDGGPRPLDCDLIFYGEEKIYNPCLIVPHPRWHTRLFVIEPLKEIESQAPLPFNMELSIYTKYFKNPHREIVEVVQ